MITPNTAFSDWISGKDAALWWGAVLLFSPALLVQAIWLKISVPRLPEAGGPIEGRVGDTDDREAIKLLVVGESTAAGVGADSHDLAFAGHAAAALHQCAATQVRWKVIAKSGMRAAALHEDLLSRIDALGQFRADIIVIILGVNDTLGLNSPAAWAHDYRSVVNLLQSHQPGARIVCAGVPPLSRFPALPIPLRHIAGARARQLDSALQRLARHCGWDYIRVPDLTDLSRTEIRESVFCRDGFHPSPAGYRRWASALVGEITESA